MINFREHELIMDGVST